MGSSSRNVPLEEHNWVDEFYFSALFDDDELIPISDEKYAEELALQEALMSAIPKLNRTTTTTNRLLTPKLEIKQEFCFVPTTTTTLITNGKRVKLEEETEPAINNNKTTNNCLCVICMDVKPNGEMFRNDNCSHSFCSDCISRHVAAKIQDNITAVRCPALNCDGVLEPQRCSSIVPREVFERWEEALCESVILGSKKLYCPYKECSAMMVGDGGESAIVTVSECPSCHKLFCARCEIPWHVGIECLDIQARKENNEADQLVLELAQTKKWRRCPGCKFYVEKSQGCLHISCRCGYEFCYSCGAKWNSKHKC